MSEGDPRYAMVNDLWMSVEVPPCSAVEAQKAARALARKFGKADGGHQKFDFMPKRMRRCWVTRKAPGKDYIKKGFGRIVHDLSHLIYERRTRGLRGHSPQHAELEYAMTAYVVGATDWLRGGLLPKLKALLSTDEKRNAKVERISQRLKAWYTKERRAKTAIAKLERQLRRLST